MSLDWPASLGERTPARERSRTSNFRVTLGRTTTDIEQELERLDPDDWRCSIGNEHTKSNGLPLHNAIPEDPGFVFQWSKDGDQFAVGCDAYQELRDNVREVYLWLKETRMRSQREVATGDTEFAAARLPGAGEDAIAGDPAPEAVLGVEADAERSAIRSAYRERVSEAHPDAGGSEDEFKRVQRAKEAMLDE
ncbi:DnaJ domain-containing protein [Haloarchaeobius sp. DFWS5]|uniref:DnaJ domain-containing protein n=1 Tax=Haloarchaeobius sp. DFWS5 TaxID=3446114 RepID=UPI003EBC208E